MAGEVDITLPLLESLGGQRADYGQHGSSADLPLLTASGWMEQHATAALTVPMQRLVISGSMGGQAVGAMRVPRQSATGRFGARAEELTVPMQTLAITATVPTIGRAALTVPLQVISGSVTVPFVGVGAALRVPMQTLSTAVGSRAALTVPMARLAATGVTSALGGAALVVPLQQVTGTSLSTSVSYPASAALTVPFILAGPYGIARNTVPMQQVFTSTALAAIYEAWCMNVRNGFVTRWTNFPFKQFARVGENTFAVGEDGNLYQLGGDLDNEDPIEWRFETGIDDLGSPALKHIPYLYLQGIIDGTIQIEIIDDRNRVFAYEYDTKDRGAIHRTHRRKLGNGIRTTNVGFALSSTYGAYVELDWLAPEATNTQRNI